MSIVYHHFHHYHYAHFSVPMLIFKCYLDGKIVIEIVNLFYFIPRTIRLLEDKKVCFEKKALQTGEKKEKSTAWSEPAGHWKIHKIIHHISIFFFLTCGFSFEFRVKFNLAYFESKKLCHFTYPNTRTNEHSFNIPKLDDKITFFESILYGNN